MNSLKRYWGKLALSREPEPQRERRGSNFSAAARVALVYCDSDEPFYKMLRGYARQLKEKFDLKSVSALGFVDSDEKKLPPWQAHKLDFDFFSRSDLNWFLKPVKGVQQFVSQDFDILIDFTGGRTLPVNFVFKNSRAHMKVGIRGTDIEPYCDLIIDMSNQEGTEAYIQQLNTYLSNPRIQ